MNKKITGQRIELFDDIIRHFMIAVENSTLYPPHHPSIEASIKIFKTYLDKWFVDEGKIELGISQDNILLNGSYVKEQSNLYSRAADYLHQRGIIAVSIEKEIDIGELINFFKFIKNDPRLFMEKRGIVKNIPKTAHLKIKEIDYSSLLVSREEEVTAEEEDVWQFLLHLEEDLKLGKLSEAKNNLLADFLKNPKRSASLLNKIYKKAFGSSDEKTTVTNIRSTFIAINKHSERHFPETAKKVRKDLLDIISNLDTNLVAGIFEEEDIDGNIFDLSKEILKELSDDAIADFITSLIGNEGVINEKLLKLFDTLTSEKGGPEDIISMVADRLFGRNVSDRNVLSKLQLSIKEIFRSYPDSRFMSGMYKITVEAFIDKEGDVGVGLAKSSELVNKYLESLKEENLKKEKIRLLLNILYFEDVPIEFKKFSDIAVGAFEEIIEPKYIKNLREIFELLIERLRPEQKDNHQIASNVKDILSKIGSKEIIDKIVSFIPAAASEDLDDIKYILVNTGKYSCSFLLDAFILEKEPLNRDKFGYVLTTMGKAASEDISRRLQDLTNIDTTVAKELFEILKAVDVEKAGAVRKKMIRCKNTQMRMEALREFILEKEEDINIIFQLFKEERHPEVKNKMLELLLQTKNIDVINNLFNILANFLNRRYLLNLVKLCGDLKIEQSLAHLRKILAKRPFLNTKRTNKLRVASVVSLAQIGSEQAIEIIKNALNDKSKAVSKMCSIVLELKDRTK